MQSPTKATIISSSTEMSPIISLIDLLWRPLESSLLLEAVNVSSGRESSMMKCVSILACQVNARSARQGSYMGGICPHILSFRLKFTGVALQLVKPAFEFTTSYCHTSTLSSMASPHMLTNLLYTLLQQTCEGRNGLRRNCL